MENKKGLKTLTIIIMIIFIICILWAILVSYNYLMVKKDKAPVLCFNYVKGVEDDDEYYKECKGILYKYKEYYYKENDVLSAREFTLFFKDYNRNLDQNF